MKEKTKQILRYVACGLGGLALGISLLGGLSMCATSGNKTTESVNTILTAERVRHNEQITTTNGGFTGYRFGVYPPYFSETIANGNGLYNIYSVDSNYNLTNIRYNQPFSCADRADFDDAVDYIVSNNGANANNDLRFLSCFGKNATGLNMYYFSFITPPNNAMNEIGSRCFLLTNISSTARVATFGHGQLGPVGQSNLYLINGGQTKTYIYDPVEPTGRLYFQDVESYYKELGYQDGYSDGETAGNSAGYSSGYNDGYDAGSSAGYEEGYDDAYAEKDSGIAFTSCGVYPNSQVTLATDETIGNFNYMYLCHYITKPGYDEHTIYIMWTTNANTGQYLGEVIDANDSDSYDPAVTLGSFTQQATSSVTITATQDMEFGLWVGYITTFHNRGEITNSILWFQGGTAESDMQIYQNGYDEGYQNGNQAGQETGYEQGYERGQEVGDAEGYSRGYTEGFNQTNTKNVFSLFTSAFDSVASFFDLKIFGFLPLYWFFLAPLFIALISLLMRMVKH